MSGDLINITKDILPTLYGVPSLKKTWVMVAMAVVIILLMVGGCMMLSWMVTGKGSKKTGLGDGGIVALTGMSIWLVVKIADFYIA